MLPGSWAHGMLRVTATQASLRERTARWKSIAHDPTDGITKPHSPRLLGEKQRKQERALSSAAPIRGANTALRHTVTKRPGLGATRCTRTRAKSKTHRAPPPPAQAPQQSPLLPEACTFWSETHGHGKAASLPCPAEGLPGFLPALASLQRGKDGQEVPDRRGCFGHRRKQSSVLSSGERPLPQRSPFHEERSPLQREAKEGLRPTARC